MTFLINYIWISWLSKNYAFLNITGRPTSSGCIFPWITKKKVIIIIELNLRTDFSEWIIRTDCELDQLILWDFQLILLHFDLFLKRSSCTVYSEELFISVLHYSFFIYFFIMDNLFYTKKMTFVIQIKKKTVT